MNNKNYYLTDYKITVLSKEPIPTDITNEDLVNFIFENAFVEAEREDEGEVIGWADASDFINNAGYADFYSEEIW